MRELGFFIWVLNRVLGLPGLGPGVASFNFNSHEFIRHGLGLTMQKRRKKERKARNDNAKKEKKREMRGLGLD